MRTSSLMPAAVVALATRSASDQLKQPLHWPSILLHSNRVFCHWKPAWLTTPRSRVVVSGWSQMNKLMPYWWSATSVSTGAGVATAVGAGVGATSTALLGSIALGSTALLASTLVTEVSAIWLVAASGASAWSAKVAAGHRLALRTSAASNGRAKRAGARCTVTWVYPPGRRHRRGRPSRSPQPSVPSHQRLPCPYPRPGKL